MKIICIISKHNQTFNLKHVDIYNIYNPKTAISKNKITIQ